MKLKLSLLLVLVTVMLVTAGCTTTQSQAPAATPVPTTATTPAPTSPTVPETYTGDWTLTSMGEQDGTAVIYPTYAITLTINPDGYLTGYTGCNNYFGTLAMTGTSTPKGEGMTISGIGATKMYCAPLANQEQDYLDILGRVVAGDVTVTELILTADTGDTLVYGRTATTPVPA